LHHLAPFLIQPDRHPDNERLVELSEEVEDIDRHHPWLQAKLEALPSSLFKDDVE